jgi:hypothetical protein
VKIQIYFGSCFVSSKYGIYYADEEQNYICCINLTVGSQHKIVSHLTEWLPKRGTHVDGQIEHT